MMDISVTLKITPDNPKNDLISLIERTKKILFDFVGVNKTAVTNFINNILDYLKKFDNNLIYTTDNFLCRLQVDHEKERTLVFEFNDEISLEFKEIIYFDEDNTKTSYIVKFETEGLYM